MRVVIAAGGTAGHVNPALALAEALRGHDVSFVGTSQGLEAELVPRAGFELHAVDVAGFDRARPAALPFVAWKAARAVGAARRILRRVRPDAVVGMGGYVSLPVTLAARTRKIPIVLHEQNIVLGLANRVARRWARVVGVSFEETLADAGPRGALVGDPIARALVDADVDEERERAIERFDLDPNRKTLIVFGGSLGALRINEAATGLAEVWRERSDVQVLHILGRRRSGADLDIAGGGPLVFRRVDFVERMVEAYAVADLALCRGGATTVAELSVMGVPSIVVPYPYHRDRQQERQARVLERAGAAMILADRDATATAVAARAASLLEDPDRLQAMGAAARKLARPDAAARLAQLVEGVAA